MNDRLRPSLKGDCSRCLPAAPQGEAVLIGWRSARKRKTISSTRSRYGRQQQAQSQPSGYEHDLTAGMTPRHSLSTYRPPAFFSEKSIFQFSVFAIDIFCAQINN
jgi:hypothetical protein